MSVKQKKGLQIIPFNKQYDSSKVTNEEQIKKKRKHRPSTPSG